MAAKAFAIFAFVLALIALFTFWPPRSPAVIVWLFFWVGLCAATGVAVLRQRRYAPFLVWAILVTAMLSAATAFRTGMLDAIGIVIDIVLFVPLIWFAIWYQTRELGQRRP